MVLQQSELVNIGSRSRQVRLVLGVASLVVGVVLATLLVNGGVTGWWRALVFIPLFVGIVSVLEARKGVCPLLAGKGQRNFEGLFPNSGIEIEDRALADRIRRVGRRVLVQSLAGGIVLTAIYLLIPA